MRKPTLGQITNVSMLIVLSIGLWKIFVHGRVPAPYKKGDHLPAQIWRTMPDAQRTIVLVERANCGFCRASMPFYSKLSKAAASSGVEVISVTPDDQLEHRSYLEASGVHVDHLVALQDTPLKISGTPTLLILDPNKTVIGAWVGQLAAVDEGNVLEVVRTGRF